jgi:hypothetical protein
VSEQHSLQKTKRTTPALHQNKESNTKKPRTCTSFVRAPCLLNPVQFFGNEKNIAKPGNGSNFKKALHLQGPDFFVG